MSNLDEIQVPVIRLKSSEDFAGGNYVHMQTLRTIFASMGETLMASPLSGSSRIADVQLATLKDMIEYLYLILDAVERLAKTGSPIAFVESSVDQTESAKE